MSLEVRERGINSDKRDYSAVLAKIGLPIAVAFKVESNPEQHYIGEYASGPEFVQIFGVNGDNDSEQIPICGFVSYELTMPWHKLTGIDYRNDLRIVTKKGIEALALTELNGPRNFPTFSVFRGPEDGALNYVKLALESRSAFPPDNGSIEITYLVVPRERNNARSLIGIINLIAGVVKVNVVSSIEEAVKDMLQSSKGVNLK